MKYWGEGTVHVQSEMLERKERKKERKKGEDKYSKESGAEIKTNRQHPGYNNN